MEVIETDGFKQDMRRLFSDEPWYVLLRFWGWISKDVWRNIKSFIQRGKRGYADSDVWNLNSYLSSWMPDALEKLRGEGHYAAYPMSILKKGMSDDEAKEKWDEIVNTIADGFRAAEDQNEYGTWDDLEKTRIKGMKLFIKHYHDLWD